MNVTYRGITEYCWDWFHITDTIRLLRERARATSAA